MLKELAIIIENKQNFNKKDELFQLGVPFPQSLISDASQLALVDKLSQTPITFSYQVLSVWPGDSIRFLLLTFMAELKSAEQRVFGLVKKTDLNAEQLTRLHAQAGAAKELSASFNQTNTLSLPSIKNSDNVTILPFESELSLLGLHGKKAAINTLNAEQPLIQSNNFTHKVNKQEGDFTFDHASALKFMSKQEWFGQAGLLKWEFTLWNPNAAIHPGGCWDLGDPGSVLFESLDLNIKPKQAFSAKWRLSAQDAFEQFEKSDSHSDLSITQTGSACEVANEGSAHFNRNIHKNAQGHIPSFFNGCELRKGDELQQLSLRASPEVFLHANHSDQNAGLAVCMAEFWQNFPKAFRIEGDALGVSLFPKQATGELYELQAGERKTHTVYIQLTDECEHLVWVNNASSKHISPKWLAQCSIFPFFPEDKASENGVNDPLASFIQQGVSGGHSFEAKREKIDEYGWRNFGDVYADHETLYQKPDEQAFVSHYNNQYDAIYGFARQYAQTGDMRWFTLMDELARHVADIDIYHTEKDRVEYNNGLFWHTDHYLDAQTCTHRTFSKHNQTSSTPGQTGGGPGTEHCYTTGLLYHYWLAGNERSKESVLKLANWMIATHEGAKSFLAQVLSAKNKELPKLIASLKGQTVSPYVYPFTRGTGNFMVALIDAFQLSGDVYYLNYLEKVIKNSLHPKDDISMRNLHDIENTWSYVVLMQSLAKYLSLKEELNQLDKAYAYARQSFMHYAQWMLENESPYLSRTDILEFPNDTWVAQEIRKVSIWVYAAKYSENQAQAFRAKAKELLDYITTTLDKSPEKHFSRIQILLMQSYGPHLYCGKELMNTYIPYQTYDFGVPKKVKAASVAFALFKKILCGLRYLSPKNEKEWIKTRRS